MATTDEKVSKFLSAITHYAEEQRHSILDEVEAFKKKELDKAEAEVLRGAYQLIQKETAEMRGSISREMSEREMESRRALLAKRQAITDEVFRKAELELLSFAQSDKYPAYLEAAAKEIAGSLTSERTVLYLKPDDMSQKELVTKEFGRPCTVEADASIRIGGLKGADPDKNLIADNSLDEKLRDQHEWFAAHSGLKVV